jgi:hypothetical protein
MAWQEWQVMVKTALDQARLKAQVIALEATGLKKACQKLSKMIQIAQTILAVKNGSAKVANQLNESMKNKTNGCGHESKEYGKGKKGKGYVEIEIKMGRMPKKKTKRK